MEEAMRAIQVSTDIFAAIWKAQEPGEVSEDAILRRLLKVVVTPAEPALTMPALPERDLKVVPEGFLDPRYDVVIPHGLEIFRTYRGKEYKAQAIQGLWILSSTNVGYGTLNELSGAIGIANENAWTNWFFRDEKGRKTRLTILRDQAKIVRRSRGPVSNVTDKTLEELGL
jgi:hypothetical protein